MEMSTSGCYVILGVTIIIAILPFEIGSLPININTSTTIQNSNINSTIRNPTTSIGTIVKSGTARIFPKGTPPQITRKEGLSSASTASNTTDVNPVKEAGPEDGTDGRAVERGFLVLAGLGIIIIAYFALKFVCVKKRRSQRNLDSRYGLIETSEMDLLEDNDDDDEEDTIFDLHSHRRT